LLINPSVLKSEGDGGIDEKNNEMARKPYDYNEHFFAIVVNCGKYE